MAHCKGKRLTNGNKLKLNNFNKTKNAETSVTSPEPAEREHQDSGLESLVHHCSFESDVTSGVVDNDGYSSMSDISMDSALSGHSWDPALASPTSLKVKCSSPHDDDEFSRMPTMCAVKSVSHKQLSPVRLNFYNESQSDLDISVSSCAQTFSTCDTRPTSGTTTPPLKKMRALNLYDTPHTPKSLVHKNQRRLSKSYKSKMSLSDMFADTVKSDSHSANHNNRTSTGSVTLGLSLAGTPQLMLDPSGRPQANVNPFTPNACSSHVNGRTVKRTRNDTDSLFSDFSESFEENVLASSKRLALHEINTCRYVEEFYELCKLGDGEFGSVYKCVNRLDGCTYAIKKSKLPVAGSSYERIAVNEVYAHAVLGKHPHVVRYYSAWAENDHMFIQNEFCEGGCLADLLGTKPSSWTYTEEEVKQLLLQLSQGLNYIHSQNLVHMDIKPGNIFIHKQTPDNSFIECELEDGESEVNERKENDDIDESIVYKIGDLGHVTSIFSPMVEEGDCRYLDVEVLHENFSALKKADVFSLGLTIYTAAGGGPLPKNGAEWHKIRGGELPDITHLSNQLNKLIKLMVHPDPALRPTALSLASHPMLCPFHKKTRSQLRQELNQEKFKNNILTRKLAEATERNTDVNSGRSRILIGNRNGKQVNRSVSLTVF